MGWLARTWLKVADTAEVVKHTLGLFVPVARKVAGRESYKFSTL